MLGCSVLGGLTPTVQGTRGFNITAVRLGVGVVELTLDTPMAPNEYAVGGGVSEPIDASFVPTKKLVSGVAKIEVRTFAGGVAADIDFDVQVSPYNQIDIR